MEGCNKANAFIKLLLKCIHPTEQDGTPKIVAPKLRKWSFTPAANGTACLPEYLNSFISTLNFENGQPFLLLLLAAIPPMYF